MNFFNTQRFTCKNCQTEFRSLLPVVGNHLFVYFWTSSFVTAANPEAILWLATSTSVNDCYLAEIHSINRLLLLVLLLFLLFLLLVLLLLLLV